MRQFEERCGLALFVRKADGTLKALVVGDELVKGDVVMKGQSITVPATGKGGGNFEIHIPREIAVTDGDILAFPESPNVAIGVIKSIIFDPRDPFQTVLARTPVNVQELRFVEVVK